MAEIKYTGENTLAAVIAAIKNLFVKKGEAVTSVNGTAPDDSGNADVPTLTWYGEWKESAVYESGDVVHYNGSSFVRQSSNAPDGGSPEEDAENWSLMASAGVGIASIEQTTTSTEDSGTNVITVTKTDGTADTFNIQNGSTGTSFRWMGEYDAGGAYVVNDVVSYEGSAYVCIQAISGTLEILPSDYDTYWSLLAQAGSDGVSVTDVYQKAMGLGSDAANTIVVELSSGEIKTFTVRNGSQGESVAITNVTASVDSSVGTPSVSVTMGGTETERTFDFTFSGLKGADGATPAKGTDYYTQTEKAEMVEAVKAALPTFTLTGTDVDDVVHTWTLYGISGA